MLEMLTGSELEQAERPCCSNVLLSFNCAQCNVCVPTGTWPHSHLELQFASGHSQKKNMCWQDPQWADGDNCTSRGEGKENDFDISWRWPAMKSDSFHLQVLKNDTKDWQSCPRSTCSPRLEGLVVTVVQLWHASLCTTESIFCSVNKALIASWDKYFHHLLLL